MIDAEINNKIPKLESWEDILTSNVFGLFELISYKYLLNIIMKSKPQLNNQKPLEDMLRNRKIVSVELWKKFPNSEPDIFIKLDHNISFIVEIKYTSGEHNKKFITNNGKIEEKGQLRKYLDIPSVDFIIYLTASYLSIKELSADSYSRLRQIYHMHWKDFNKYLKGFLDKTSNDCEKRVLEKITDYLDFKGFDHWDGFKVDYGDIKIIRGGFCEKK